MKKKFISRLSAAALAGAMSISSLLPSLEASATTVSFGASDCKTNYNSGKKSNAKLSANNYGVKGAYIDLTTENIVAYNLSGQSDWGLCLNPTLSSGAPATTRQQSTSYWNNLPDRMKKAIGLAMYYGYPNAASGKSAASKAYFNATQMIVWEIVLGYRNSTTFEIQKDSSGVKRNVIGSYNANAATKKAYETIAARMKTHYTVPKALNTSATSTYKSGKTVLLKYSFPNNNYSGSFVVGKDNTPSLKKWNSSIKTQVQNLMAAWNKKGGLTGKLSAAQINAKLSVADTGTGYKYTVTSSRVPFDTNHVSNTGKIDMELPGNTGLSNSWLIYSVNNNSQDITTKPASVDPARGYVSFAYPNYGNLNIYKVFKLDGKKIKPEDHEKYKNDVSFTIKTTQGGKTYYVLGERGTSGNYVFAGTTTDANKATYFKFPDSGAYNTEAAKLKVSVLDLPTATYKVTEHIKANTVAATFKAASNDLSVTLEAPSATNPTKNADTEAALFINQKNSPKYTSVQLNKKQLNIDGNRDLDVDAYFAAFILKDGKIQFLKGLKAEDRGDYAYTEGTTVKEGEFTSNALTTDISAASILHTSTTGGSISIGMLPEGTSVGFIEIKAEQKNGTPEYGCTSEVYNNKVNWTDFADKIKSYTDSTAGVMIWNKENTKISTGSTALVKGVAYPFVYSTTHKATLNLRNEEYYVDVKVKKTDDDNKPLAGSEIGLFNKDNELLDSVVTGDDGIAAFKYKFESVVTENDGYYYKELVAPNGYQLNEQKFTISFNNSAKKENGTVYGSLPSHLDTVENLPVVVNKKYYGEIHINKVDSSTDKPMAGITFELKANKDMTAEDIAKIKVENGVDIKLADGDVKAGEVFCTATTDEKGIIDITNLPVGESDDDGNYAYTYTATETNMPKGYYGAGPYEFTFDDNDYDADRSVVTGRATLYNDQQVTNSPEPIPVKIYKYDNYKKPIAGVKFNVIADEDVVLNDEIVQKNGEIVGTLTTDANGYAQNYKLKGDKGAYEYDFEVYGGFKYQIVESSVPTGIALDTTPKYFTAPFSSTGEVMEFTYNKENRWSKAKVDIIKLDSKTRQPLNGAVFEIWKDTDKNGKFDPDVDTKLEVNMTATGKDGEYRSESDLEYGAYFIKETKAPKGYVLDDTAYLFNVEQDGVTVHAGNYKDKDGNTVFLNKPITGSVTITKTDVTTSEALPNTKIRIYDSNKKVIRQGKTDKNGKITFKNLTYGTYYFQEYEAPKGYVIDTSLKKFTITVDGKIEKAKMTNRKITGGIEITKTDVSTSKTLPNTGIRIYDENGNKLAEGRTDKNGKITFKNLTYGKYYFQEFDAPKGYLLNNEKHWFEIKTDGTIIHDKLTDVVIPKTGVDNDMAIPITAAAASAVGLVSITIIAKGKKKRED